MLRLPKLPPCDVRGPRPVPVLGTLGNMLSFFRDPVRTMRSLHERYGLLAALADRDPAVLCVFGGEYNRQVLSDHRLFHNWSELPIPVPEDSAPARLATALTNMNGDVHRRHRRLMMPAFQKSSIDGYQGDMVALTERALGGLVPGETLDVSKVMKDLTMHIALRCLFGLESELDSKRLGAMAMQFTQRIISPWAMLLPYRIPGIPYERFMHTSEQFEAELREVIARRRERPSDRDVISALLRAHDEDGSTFTDAELVGQAAVLFIAGHETTSFTLSWTLFLLSQHPRVHAALLDELHGVLRGAPPSPEQFARLPLLDAVIKESQRLMPATPYLFLRRSTAPFELGGHALPAGVTLLLSPLVTHRSSEVFPEPQRFRPERWQGLQPTPYEYLPFGAGPRMCIGAGFSSQALRVVLAMLLQRHRLSLVDGARVSYKVQGITLGPRFGMPMRVGGAQDPVPTPVHVRGDIHELIDLSPGSLN
jgi:cytochrome P450